jgi:hypothetical protein
MAITFLRKIGVNSPRRASSVALVLGQKRLYSWPLAPVGVRFAYVRGHRYQRRKRPTVSRCILGRCLTRHQGVKRSR